MPDSTFAPPAPPTSPPIVDHRRVPLGVLPRQLPRWLLLGTALVMAGIMALSGPSMKPRSASTSSAPAATASDANQQRIEEYQRRIQEETQRLVAEQAALEAAKRPAPGTPEIAGPILGNPKTQGQTRSTNEHDRHDGSAGPDGLRQERAQRAYRSLFADNVAFSREPRRPLAPSRTVSTAATPAASNVAFPVAVDRMSSATTRPMTGDLSATDGSASAVAPVRGSPLASSPMLFRVAIPESSTPGPNPASGDPDSPSAGSGHEDSRHPADDHASGAASSAQHRTEQPSPRTARNTQHVAPGASGAFTNRDAPTYALPEGTLIETVLTNRLDGTFAGPVNCLVTTAVYAPDLQHLLIPAGARVLGDAHPVTTFGQSRLAVVFHRLLLPNGTSLDLEHFHGLNQLGETGLRDQVDRHYAQIFGASLAVGAIAGLAQAQTSIGLDATAFDTYRQGAADNLAQSSARILDRFLNLLPTVTIREGHRIKIYLSNDVQLPAYRDQSPTTPSAPSGDPS